MGHRNFDAFEGSVLDDPCQSIQLLGCQILGKFGRDLHRRHFFHDFPEYLVDAVRLSPHQVFIVTEQGSYGDQAIYSLFVGLLPLALRSEGDMYDFTHAGPSTCAAMGYKPQDPYRPEGDP